MIIGIIIFIVAITLYACCVISGRADDAAERYYNSKKSE